MRLFSTTVFWEPGDVSTKRNYVTLTGGEVDPSYSAAIILDNQVYLHVNRTEVRNLANELTRLASELVSKLDDRSNNTA